MFPNPVSCVPMAVLCWQTKEVVQDQFVARACLFLLKCLVTCAGLVASRKQRGNFRMSPQS